MNDQAFKDKCAEAAEALNNVQVMLDEIDAGVNDLPSAETVAGSVHQLVQSAKNLANDVALQVKEIISVHEKATAEKPESDAVDVNGNKI